MYGRSLGNVDHSGIISLQYIPIAELLCDEEIGEEFYVGHASLLEDRLSINIVNTTYNVRTATTTM